MQNDVCTHQIVEKQKALHQVTNLCQDSPTRNQIAGHERQRQLLRELVLSIPDAVMLRVKILPKVRNSLGQSVLIRIYTLEGIHHECTENLKF